MNPYTLFSQIRDAISEDVALNSWSTGLYGNGITMFHGLGSQDSPDGSDLPWLAIDAFADSRSQQRRDIDFEQEGSLTVAAGSARSGLGANIVEPGGVKDLDDGLALVRAAIVDALPDGVEMIEWETVIDALGIDGTVSGHFRAAYIQQLVIGQDPMT